jgi:hypothetical protein
MPEDTNTSYDQVSVDNPRPELSAEPIDKQPIIIGVGVALGFLLISLALGWWLFLHPVAAAIIRDILIIYIGVGIFVVILLLIVLVVITSYLVIKVNDLVQLTDREIRPVLANIQESINTVRGTTVFLSDHAVQPVISTLSSVTAVKTIVRSLFQRN